MSDNPQGPDWWYASDGKWYPPDLASDPTVGVREEAPVVEVPEAAEPVDSTEAPHDPFAPSPHDAAFTDVVAPDEWDARLDQDEPSHDDRRALLFGGVAALIVIGLLTALWWSSRVRVSDLEDELATSETLREQLEGRAGEVEAAEQRATAAEAELDEALERAEAAESRVDELEAVSPTVPPDETEGEVEPEVESAPTLPPTAVVSIDVPGGIDDVSLRPGAASTISATGSYAVVDVGTNQTLATLPVSGSADKILDAGESGIHVTDPAGGAVVLVTPGAAVEATRVPVDDPAGLTFLAGSVWVASRNGAFVGVVDRASATLGTTISLPAPAVGLTAAGGVLWATSPDAGSVHRIDPATGVVDTISVGSTPEAITPGLGRIWIADRDAGVVHTIDPDTLEPARDPLEVGGTLTALAVAGDSLWVVSSGPDELVQLDAVTGDVVTRTPLGGPIKGISVGHDSVWVTVPTLSSLVRVTAPT